MSCFEWNLFLLFRFTLTGFFFFGGLGNAASAICICNLIQRLMAGPWFFSLSLNIKRVPVWLWVIGELRLSTPKFYNILPHQNISGEGLNLVTEYSIQWWNNSKILQIFYILIMTHSQFSSLQPDPMILPRFNSTLQYSYIWSISPQRIHIRMSRIRHRETQKRNQQIFNRQYILKMPTHAIEFHFYLLDKIGISCSVFFFLVHFANQNAIKRFII